MEISKMIAPIWWAVGGLATGSFVGYQVTGSLSTVLKYSLIGGAAYLIYKKVG